jgi:hypothetical protein
VVAARAPVRRERGARAAPRSQLASTMAEEEKGFAATATAAKDPEGGPELEVKGEPRGAGGIVGGDAGGAGGSTKLTVVEGSAEGVEAKGGGVDAAETTTHLSFVAVDREFSVQKDRTLVEKMKQWCVLALRVIEYRADGCTAQEPGRGVLPGSLSLQPPI